MAQWGNRRAFFSSVCKTKSSVAGIQLLTYADSFLVHAVQADSVLDPLQVQMLASGGKQSAVFEVTIMLLS
jgi:hypothetical protein